MIWLAIVWVLNALISWWNAFAVGRSWKETKAAGGWPRFMAWMGAIMADCGFSWCLLILMVVVGHACSPHRVTDRVVSGSMALGFMILAPAMVCSGLAIMLESWKRAFREGGFANYSVAVYNTYAQLNNTVSMVEGMGQASQAAGELFKGSATSGSASSSSSSGSSASADDVKGIAIVIAVLIVLVAFIGGTMLTYYIIRSTSRSQELPWAVRERLSQEHKGFDGGGRLQPA